VKNNDALESTEEKDNDLASLNKLFKSVNEKYKNKIKS